MMDDIKMTTQDALWLTMDRPNNLMVIDGIMWFREQPDWDAVDQTLRERLLDRYPVFRCSPVHTDDGWVWREDPNFRLDSVVHRVKLPGTDGPEELRRFVAEHRSIPFDKAGPMWTAYLIGNVTLDDGTMGAAVMTRFHHSIADGIRLTQVVMSLCDLDEDAGMAVVGKDLHKHASKSEVASSVARKVTGSIADTAETTVSSGAHAVGSALNVARTAAAGDVAGAVGDVVHASTNIFSAGLSAIKHPERFLDVSRLVSTADNRPANDLVGVGTLLLAPPSIDTVWTGTPSVAKDAGWAPMISLQQVKEVGRATGTTVNDVVISAVAGALDRYLREHGDDTVDELIWLVPVSLKPIDLSAPTELGNHFALVALRMPMGMSDVKARLAEMHDRMDRLKNSDEALVTFGVQRVISQSPDRIATALTNYFANKGVGVLTNVPGPRVPMRLAGTEVDGVLGWAPCSGDQPMTICIYSYNGQVTVGFGTDKSLVPDTDKLGSLLEIEFADMYESVVGGAA